MAPSVDGKQDPRAAIRMHKKQAPANPVKRAMYDLGAYTAYNTRCSERSKGRRSRSREGRTLDARATPRDARSLGSRFVGGLPSGPAIVHLNSPMPAERRREETGRIPASMGHEYFAGSRFRGMGYDYIREMRYVPKDTRIIRSIRGGTRGLRRDGASVHTGEEAHTYPAMRGDVTHGEHSRRQPAPETPNVHVVGADRHVVVDGEHNYLLPGQNSKYHRTPN